MVRLAIIGVIVAVAFILYALIDAAMSDPARSRGVSKPVWVVLIVVLPVIGAALWFTIGKNRGPISHAPASAPDDDPRFSGRRMSDDEIDAHVEELEARLRELDEEVFPEVDIAGEQPEELKQNGGARPDNVSGKPENPVAKPDSAANRDGDSADSASDPR